MFDATMRAFAQMDVEIKSSDRQTGIMSTNKVVPLALTSIPSQIPITVSINKIDKNVMLSTTAYLKGMGTGKAYEGLIKDFYAALFLGLNIQNEEEKRYNTI